MCLCYSVVPKFCADTVIVPIIKNKNRNIHDVSNYCPIAIAAVVLKLFKYFMLYH